MSEPRPQTVALGVAPAVSRSDLVPLAALVALGGAVRIVYVVLRGIPHYDPWRHLLLVQNIRDGAGFTLFDGQPYLWYSPVWYYLCALLPEKIGMGWLATFFSLAAVPATYVLLLGCEEPRRRRVAVAGALLMAVSGPLIAFTCHYGAEALALALVLGALLVACRGRGVVSALVAGLAFGLALVLRLNFALNVFLFVPYLRGPRRFPALLSGIAVPLALTWWRNHRIIAAHPWVFTWDGLATRSSDFTPLSTLMVQMHPAVQEGLRRLHAMIVPWPEWYRGHAGLAWGTILFVLCGTACVLASRRPSLILTGTLTLFYFFVLDASNSSHFFRIYLGLFPAFFLAAASVAGRLWRLERPAARWLGWIPVLLLIVGGAGYLRPPDELTLQRVTPPEGFLQEERYMVTSAFFHPESLIYRHRDKRFIGMPLDPEQFAEFREQYPDYRHVLWHEVSVQDALITELLEDSAYRVVRSRHNESGHRYVVLERTGRSEPR